MVADFGVAIKDQDGDLVSSSSCAANASVCIDMLEVRPVPGTLGNRQHRYRAITSGTYWIFASLGDAPIRDSPFPLTVAADASTVSSASTLSGEGVIGGVVGRTQVFTVSRRDAFGNVRTANDDEIVVDVVEGGDGIRVRPVLVASGVFC